MIHEGPPGMSFRSMSDWIERVRYAQLPREFTNELFLGIFWEETFFNNVRQQGKGTGVGFGQVEPSTFITLHGGDPADDARLDADERRFRQYKRNKARSFGYFIDPSSIPTITQMIPVRKKDASGQWKTRMERKVSLAPGVTLSLELGIKLSMCALHHLYAEKGSRSSALKAYGGIGYTGSGNPMSDSKRLKKLNGIVACEKHLLQLPKGLTGRPREDSIMRALNKAKNFELKYELWRDILFNAADRALEEMAIKYGFR